MVHYGHIVISYSSILGKGMIGYQPVNGLPNVWRMVVAGDVSHISTQHIDELIDCLVELGQEL